MGETAIRLRSVTSRMASGVIRLVVGVELIVPVSQGGLYRKLTPLYSFSAGLQAHALSMGHLVKRMLLGTVAAALGCAASEGLELNSKGLELYRGAHYAEAEAMYRRALDAVDRDGAGAGVNRALTLEDIAVIVRAQ